MTEPYVQASLVAMLRLLSSATKNPETAMEKVSDAAQDVEGSPNTTERSRLKKGGVYVNGHKFIAANDC
jgi:hypothetical protein